MACGKSTAMTATMMAEAAKAKTKAEPTHLPVSLPETMTELSTERRPKGLVFLPTLARVPVARAPVVPAQAVLAEGVGEPSESQAGLLQGFSGHVAVLAGMLEVPSEFYNVSSPAEAHNETDFSFPRAVGSGAATDVGGVASMEAMCSPNLLAVLRLIRSFVHV